MSATPAPEPQQEQQGVQIPEWIIQVVGRQQLELEILRQQLAAANQISVKSAD